MTGWRMRYRKPNRSFQAPGRIHLILRNDDTSYVCGLARYPEQEVTPRRYQNTRWGRGWRCKKCDLAAMVEEYTS